jgi:hypothetical protein
MKAEKAAKRGNKALKKYSRGWFESPQIGVCSLLRRLSRLTRRF